jgi:hypothetical protein
MSVTVMRAIYVRGPSRPGPRAVLLAIALRMNDKDWSTLPYRSAKHLADDTRYSVRTVREHLQTLESDGWIRIVGGGGVLGTRPDGTPIGRASSYVLNLEMLGLAAHDNGANSAPLKDEKCENFQERVQKLHPIKILIIY